MGCHTWVYKKYKACSREQKDKILNACNNSLKHYLKPYKYYAKSMKETARMYMKYCEKGSQEYASWVKYLKEDVLKTTWQEIYNKYEKFKEGVFDDNVTDFCKDDESASYTVINGELYIEVSFDYPFRCYGYPEESFTDKEQLLEWLKQKDGRLYGYYDYKSSEFIEGYTDELVDRINNYFSENGEDNLYFEFG